MRGRHPYHGRRAAIGTMHAKERVIAPALSRCLGLIVECAEGIDTDALGTFTGEIPRAGDMVEAARAKARLAMARSSVAMGIGSEGAFGPHPVVPFLASGIELIALVDAENDYEIVVQRRTRTNYDSIIAGAGENIAPFLARIGFPDHAVIVRPEGRSDAVGLVKGLTDQKSLDRAISAAAALSRTGRATVQTDMRAHLNPTRMKTIAFVARALALRAARLCPVCRAPGFGIREALRGLACADCGAPTRRVRAEIHGCLKCGFRCVKRERPASLRAEAMWCDACNP
jgi:hypothetical protein